MAAAHFALVIQCGQIFPIQQDDSGSRRQRVAKHICHQALIRPAFSFGGNVDQRNRDQIGRIGPKEPAPFLGQRDQTHCGLHLVLQRHGERGKLHTRAHGGEFHMIVTVFLLVDSPNQDQQIGRGELGRRFESIGCPSPPQQQLGHLFVQLRAVEDFVCLELRKFQFQCRGEIPASIVGYHCDANFVHGRPLCARDVRQWKQRHCGARRGENRGCFCRRIDCRLRCGLCAGLQQFLVVNDASIRVGEGQGIVQSLLWRRPRKQQIQNEG